MFVPDHQHVIVDLRVLKPLLSEDAVISWLSRIVKAVHMEILLGPFAVACRDAGNEGVTGMVILSTSHCSVHVWPLVEPAIVKVDLYSCKAFTQEQIDPLLAEMEPTTVNYVWIDRNR